MFRFIGVVLLLVLLILATGCNSTQKGIGYGALTGAVVGGTCGFVSNSGGGYPTQGDTIVWGAAAGAVFGAIVGAVTGYCSRNY